MTKNSISRQLYLARITANLTQIQLAEKAGLSVPTISNIENDDKIGQVSLGNIQKYCAEVGKQISIEESESADGQH